MASQACSTSAGVGVAAEVGERVGGGMRVTSPAAYDKRVRIQRIPERKSLPTSGVVSHTGAHLQQDFCCSVMFMALPICQMRGEVPQRCLLNRALPTPCTHRTLGNATSDLGVMDSTAVASRRCPTLLTKSTNPAYGKPGAKGGGT